MSNNFLVELEVQEGKIELKWICANFEVKDNENKDNENKDNENITTITLKDKIELFNSLVKPETDSNKRETLSKTLMPLKKLDVPICSSIGD